MKNLRGIATCAAPFALLAVMFFGLVGPTDALFSQYLGAAAILAMAQSHIISTRTRWVERLYGPMDQAYVLHKWLGIGALIAILLHDSIGAEIKALGLGTPLSNFAEDLGEQSLNGLLILIAITLMTFIPYRIWYWTHRAMGVCFVIGVVHYALILKPFSVFDPLGLYVLGFCLIGTLSYVYTLLPRRWRPSHSYRIESIEKTGHACAITMQPEGHPIRHRAGQFAFFTFNASGLAETHPFSISSAPRADGSIRISVAKLGDYTTRLGRGIEVGTTVQVQGPYGRFFPSRSKKSQVWIAGGIGITPFLAWLEALDTVGPSVDLVYTFRGSLNAPHLTQVKQMTAGMDRVKLHLFDTSTGPRVCENELAKIIDLKKSKVSFCGPVALREKLKEWATLRSLRAEAFEIRTGLPIPTSVFQFFAHRTMKYSEMAFAGYLR